MVQNFCKASYSIIDIIKIITKFGNEYESFDLSISAEGFSYDENKGIFCLSKVNWDGLGKPGYGSLIATRGRKYHWKLKLSKSEKIYFNLGVIKAEDAAPTINNFWYRKCAYSYYEYNGNIYSGDFGRSGRKYGDPYGVGDIIDIWLDLRDDNHTIAWDKNGIKSDKKIEVALDTEYRLAVCTNPGEIELMFFEIIY